jgi:hypothetical protein
MIGQARVLSQKAPLRARAGKRPSRKAMVCRGQPEQDWPGDHRRKPGQNVKPVSLRMITVKMTVKTAFRKMSVRVEPESKLGGEEREVELVGSVFMIVPCDEAQAISSIPTMTWARDRDLQEKVESCRNTEKGALGQPSLLGRYGHS